MLFYDERAGEAALGFGQRDRLDALGATLCLAVLAHLRALAVAVIGDHEQVHVVASDVHRDHFALLANVHSLDAARAAAHRAGV